MKLLVIPTGYPKESTDHLKEYYEIFSSPHLNRLFSYINIVPKTNPIPKISHVKTLQNSCKMRYKFGGKNNKKVRK